MKFEIAELPLDHEDAWPYINRLDRDIGQGLDIEARRYLDHERRHVGARKKTATKCAQIAHGLGLQLIDEDVGAQGGHYFVTNALSSSRMMRRIS